MSRGIKRFLDYIPLIILLVSAIILLWEVAIGNALLNWKHYVGLCFQLSCLALFFIRHLYGVLFLGITLIFGLVGLLSFSASIETVTFGVGGSDDVFQLLSFQPIFLLWLVVFCVCSWRHIYGIGTKEYWTEVKNRQR